MKRLFLFLLLLVLTPLCALADDYTPKYNLQPVPAERIDYTLPIGIKLAQPISKTDGRLTIIIDSEKTDWTSVIASATHHGGIDLSMRAMPPANAVNQKNTGVGNGYNPEEETLEEAALRNLDRQAGKQISSSREPEQTDYWNGHDIVQFDPESSSVIPSVRDEDHYFAHLVIWNPTSSNPICEYFFVDVRFTDDSARKVKMTNVPAERLTAHAADKLKAVVSGGAVDYTLESGHSLNQIETFIAAPNGATHYALYTPSGVSPISPVHPYAYGDSRMGFWQNQQVASNEQAYLSHLSILWYGDEDGKNLLTIERFKLSLIIGDPQPYPRYFRERGEIQSVPADRLIVPLYLSAPNMDSSFINMRYEDDTYRITVEPGQLPEGIELDDCAYETMIAAPSNAVCYSTAGGSSDSIYGFFEDRYTDAVERLEDPDSRSNEFYMHEGRRVAPLGGPMLATSRSFNYDPDLKLYTPTSITGEYAGSVEFIYWYDSFDPEAEPILKEYYVFRTDPFSVTMKPQPALKDESELPPPEGMKIPVIVLDGADKERELFLVIENHVYSGKNMVVYGLHVQDADGNVVDLKTDATVILPYPKGVGMGSPGRITLNHYDASGVICYSEDSANPKYRLTRTPHGISFRNQTFSPFVLSWEEAPADSTAALPKTGDSSLPLALLLGMLFLSAFALISLNKSRA